MMFNSLSVKSYMIDVYRLQLDYARRLRKSVKRKRQLSEVFSVQLSLKKTIKTVIPFKRQRSRNIDVTRVHKHVHDVSTAIYVLFYCFNLSPNL